MIASPPSSQSFAVCFFPNQWVEISHKIQEQCRSIGGPEVPTTRNSAFLGATSPMTPGRGQMMSGRGRCFLEVGGDLIDVEKSCRFDGRLF